MSSRRRRAAATGRVVAAERAARRGTFTNSISLQNVPLRHAIVLDGQPYDPRGLVRWFAARLGQNATVPHTRRRASEHEVRAVHRAAELADGHEGWAPLHEMFPNRSPPPNASPRARRIAKEILPCVRAALLFLRMKTVLRGSSSSETVARAAARNVGVDVGWSHGTEFEHGDTVAHVAPTADGDYHVSVMLYDPRVDDSDFYGAYFQTAPLRRVSPVRHEPFGPDHRMDPDALAAVDLAFREALETPARGR